MCRPAFDALDRNWTTLVHDPEAQAALRRWGGVPELAAPDLQTLVETIWASDRPTADRACGALATLAPTDETAARVLLQVLRPGLRHLGRRLAFGAAFEDVDHEILAIAWERIRTYPIDRRPRSIAANILLDVRKRYLRGILGPDAGAVPLDAIPEAYWPVAPSAEDDALDTYEESLRRAHGCLVDAVERGRISRLSAAVIWRTRVNEDDDADVAAEFGLAVRTLQRRRQRAARQLAAAC